MKHITYVFDCFHHFIFPERVFLEGLLLELDASQQASQKNLEYQTSASALNTYPWNAQVATEPHIRFPGNILDLTHPTSSCCYTFRSFNFQALPSWDGIGDIGHLGSMAGGKTGKSPF